MKAVIYARYSSDNQREESIEGQLRECTAFAEKNGITVFRHYISASTNIVILSFQTVFPPLFPKICVTVCRSGWRRTGALLPAQGRG